MSRLSETQVAAFTKELEKISSKWYSGAVKSVSDFGKRQVHGLTGWTPKGYNNTRGIEEIGAGAASSRAWDAAAKKTGDFEERARAAAALKANEAAQAAGHTSIPGIVGSFVKDPKNAARTAWRQQWDGTSKWEKALLLGAPTAGLAMDTVSDDDGHKGERMGAGIASTAAGLATGGLGFVPGMVAGTAAGYLGSKAGKQVDKLRGKVQAPPNPEDAKGLAVPHEREMSPSASGQSQVFG